MTQTAAAYDPQIRINDRDDLAAMPGELRSLVEAQLLSQLANGAGVSSSDSPPGVIATVSAS